MPKIETKDSLFDKDFLFTILLYVFSAIVLTQYCLHACTFEIEPNPREFLFIVLGSFAITLLLRTCCLFLIRRFETQIKINGGFRIKNPWHYLFIDLASWVFAGILTICLSIQLFKSTFVSNIEILVGCFSMGVFYSRYLSLRIEKEMIITLAKLGDHMNLSPRRFFSISTKFFLFVMACLTIISSVAILLFYKDFIFMEAATHSVSSARFQSALYEYLFVIFILCTGAFAVAYQYRDNFKIVLDYQLKAFNFIEKGNYCIMVPVVTEDEFSQIAVGTNRLILGLQEREKIKTAFGKYMSPAVANSILESERGTSLEGRLVNVSVMFIDIRNYTHLSENMTPQEAVRLLNSLFSLVVKCVYKFHGVVDKFIGDAAMILFGLEGKDHSAESAMKTALEIIHSLPELNKNLKQLNLPEIQIGIGIHQGPAVAGNIGSEERMEYTVIGDTVNIASRLESLNKQLSMTLTVSEEIYQALPPELQTLLTFKGAHPLKGKSQELQVYSL